MFRSSIISDRNLEVFYLKGIRELGIIWDEQIFVFSYPKLSHYGVTL